MEKKREISEYRERLDKTLASPELINEQSLKTLIRNQLSINGNQECNDEILDQRTADVSSILKKLRSVSMKDHELLKSSNEEASYGDWKVKHDHEDCRVMYREGLEGNPFHTLLVEGYVDGPVEDCLCVSWESSLYEKWWPKTAFPAFRILQTKCLQKFRIDEQICSVRMKVPWPLADREAVVHYFLFEYFKDGLVVILLNSISDAESTEVSTNESNKNGIPEAMNAVRIDLVGGCAIQKVTPEKSYFRTIADLDIKLDMFPPSLINFMSRQLIGNGFRLYKKSVASVAKFDEDYSKALADPLYTWTRRALYSTDKTDEIREANEVVNSDEECIVLEKEQIQEKEAQCVPSCENGPVLEIEEEESVSSDENVTKKAEINCERQFCISPQVEQALGTLERVISMVRRSRTDSRIEEENALSSSDEELSSPNHLSFLIEKSEIVSSSKDPKIEVLDHNINNRRAGSNSFAREGNKIAPGSPEQDLTASEVTRITISQATTLFRQTAETDNCNSKMEAEAGQKHGNLSNGKNLNLQRKDRKPRCLAFTSCF